MAEQQQWQSDKRQPASDTDTEAKRVRQSGAEPETAEYDKKTDGPNRPSV